MSAGFACWYAMEVSNNSAMLVYMLTVNYDKGVSGFFNALDVVSVLRAETRTTTWFFENYGPAMVGAKDWKEKYKTELVSDFVPASLEATGSTPRCTKMGHLLRVLF